MHELPTPPEGKRNISKRIIKLAILASEFNISAKNMDSGDGITQEQFDIAAAKIKRIEKLTKSGKFRILSVDTWDSSEEEMIYDFDNEEAARKFAKEKISEERKFFLEAGAIKGDEIDNPCTSEVMYLYNPQGSFLGKFPI